MDHGGALVWTVCTPRTVLITHLHVYKDDKSTPTSSRKCSIFRFEDWNVNLINTILSPPQPQSPDLGWNLLMSVAKQTYATVWRLQS
jgi:hypothetical protein